MPCRMPASRRVKGIRICLYRGVAYLRLPEKGTRRKREWNKHRLW